MTTIKILSAGLIAVAMLATPVMARENAAADPYLGERADAGAAARHQGRFRIPAMHARAFAAPPDGESCEVGDDPEICSLAVADTGAVRTM